MKDLGSGAETSEGAFAFFGVSCALSMFKLLFEEGAGLAGLGPGIVCSLSGRVSVLVCLE